MGIARKGGGGGALPKFFDPFFHNVFPYILTSISCYLILFGHFKHQNHQKYQNYYHNYHSHHCRNHRYLVLLYSLNVVFDVPKKLYNLPELGEGGRGNLGNGRKKTVFLIRCSLIFLTIKWMEPFLNPCKLQHNWCWRWFLGIQLMPSFHLTEPFHPLPFQSLTLRLLRWIDDHSTD